MHIQNSRKRKISDKEFLPESVSPTKKAKPRQKTKHLCSDSSSDNSEGDLDNSNTDQLDDDEDYDDDEEDSDVDDYTDTNESLTDNMENDKLVRSLHRLLRDANFSGSDSMCK